MLLYMCNDWDKAVTCHARAENAPASSIQNAMSEIVPLKTDFIHTVLLLLLP